jgi:UPF0755 protein
MKKIIPFFAIGLLLLSLGIFYWWQDAISPFNPSQKETKSFVIKRGLTVSQIGNKLSDEGLIKSPLAFKVYLQFQGRSDQIKAGEYKLSPSESMKSIVEKLIKGPDLVWVTFPEGLRREEMVLKLVNELEIKDKENFYIQFMQASDGKEGFLFPDTYLFPREVVAEKVVSVLYDNFNKKIAPFQEDIKKSNMSLNEIITLASIVERETKTDEERPLVAGILIKRLKDGWPLQVDASVQYAVAAKNCKVFGAECKWWPILSKEDMSINSPFNSYKFKGLPPHPIANPGLSSIKAVIYPKESDYWFYLHDKSGKIYFAKTTEEHEENIRNYLAK